MAQALITYQALGKTAVNTVDVFHGLGSSLLAAEAIATHWETDVMPNLAQQCVFTGVIIQGAIPVEAPRSVPGGVNDPMASINTAFIANKNPDSGRRGRWFIPGIPEENVDGNGTINEGRRLALQAGLDSFLGKVNAEPVELRIARADGSFSTIESFSVQSIAGTQRRRMRR